MPARVRKPASASSWMRAARSSSVRSERTSGVSASRISSSDVRGRRGASGVTASRAYAPQVCPRGRVVNDAMRGQGSRTRMVALAAAMLTGALATPAHAASPQTPPHDPLFDGSPLPNATSEQWDLASPAGGFDRGISADRAWPLATGAGVTIADVDVGVQLDHPDLAGRWAVNPGETGTAADGRDRSTNGVDDDRDGYVDDWGGWDFYGFDNNPTSDTSNSHGTNVAGVLGAAANNDSGRAVIGA